MADSIKIIPLGGFDKIGMNMTLIESEDSIIAVDCGISFPPDNMPGIEGIVPDVSYLKKNKDKFKGIVLTHGHEDHIGAIPYVISEIKAPIYGTPLTIALVENRLSEFGITDVKTKAIKMGSTIVVGSFKVEFILTNHSIPDCAMLAIYTPRGILVHTGDFKLDMSPVVGETGNISRLSALGTKGVLAVMSDSTNANENGFSKSEYNVNEQLGRLFGVYRKSRLIIVTFATNMFRVQQIIDLAYRYGRKVVIEGDLLLEVLDISRKLGYVSIPDGVVISADDIQHLRDEEVVFLTSGNHGASVQCISEIAAGRHSIIKIKKDDVVLFSSVAIHGSEIEFNRTLNNLEELGAKVIFQELHATGHACSEELKILYTILRPKYLIPAHGEYRYRREAKRLAMEVGVPEEGIFLISNGDILELSDDMAVVTGSIPIEEILVDGREKRRIDASVIGDRRQLSESGVVVVEVCIDKKSGRLASKVGIKSCGFIGEKNFETISTDLREAVLSEISRLLGQGVRDQRIQNSITDVVSDFILDKTGKKPVVIVFVTEVVL